jgi:hypothetical protein
VQSDQYARVPKHGRMLALFDPVVGLIELRRHGDSKKGSNSLLKTCVTATSLFVRSLTWFVMRMLQLYNFEKQKITSKYPGYVTVVTVYLTRHIMHCTILQSKI